MTWGLRPKDRRERQWEVLEAEPLSGPRGPKEGVSEGAGGAGRRGTVGPEPVAGAGDGGRAARVPFVGPSDFARVRALLCHPRRQGCPWSPLTDRKTEAGEAARWERRSWVGGVFGGAGRARPPAAPRLSGSPMEVSTQQPM